MYIYLIKNGDFKEHITREHPNSEGGKSQDFHGYYLHHGESDTPFINPNADAEVLQKDDVLKKFFLKATERKFPDYPAHREYGVYKFGKAHAELTRANNGPYFLQIETTSFENLKDLETIQVEIAAGRISPHISYVKEQKGQQSSEAPKQPPTRIQQFFQALGFVR